MKSAETTQSSRRVSLTLGQPLSIAATLLLVSCLSGCGAATYTARAEKTAGELEKTSAFSRALYDKPTTISDTAEFRIPRFFDGDSETFRPGDQVNPLRISPMRGIPIPGFKYTYEKRVGSASSKVPVYMYVATLPGDRLPLADIQKAIAVSVQAGVPGASANFEIRDVLTPEANTIKTTYLTVTGKQQFDVGQDYGGVQTKDGRFDLYIYSTKGQHIIIGWRAPNQANEADIFNAGERSVGTIVVENPPPVEGA